MEYTPWWTIYGWLPNQGIDYVIHPDDLNAIYKRGGGFGLCKCIGEEGDYLIIDIRGLKIRVKKDNDLEKLPAPKYRWGEKVLIKDERIIAKVDYLFWHDLHKEYKYNLLILYNKEKIVLREKRLFPLI